MIPRSSFSRSPSRSPSPDARGVQRSRGGVAAEAQAEPPSTVAGAADFHRLPPELRSLVLQWVVPVPQDLGEALAVRPRVPPVALTSRAFREATHPVVAAALWCLACSDDIDHAQLGALPVDRFLTLTNHLPPGMGFPQPMDRLRVLIDLAMAPWQTSPPADAIDWVLQETPVCGEAPFGFPIDARAMALLIAVEHACAEDRDSGVRDMASFELLEICLHHFDSLLDATSPHGVPVALQQALVDLALLMPYGGSQAQWVIAMGPHVLLDWTGVRRLADRAGIDPTLIEQLPALAKFIAVADLYDPQALPSHPDALQTIETALNCLAALPAPYTPSVAEALMWLSDCALTGPQTRQLEGCHARDPRWRAAV